MEGLRTDKEGDLVVVGEKPVRNYVVACITLFNAGASTVRVRARGKHISRAVDTVELLKRVFIKDLRVEEIKIGTDELVNEEGKDVGVSTIEITLTKPEMSQTVNRALTHATRLLGRRRW
ncbi:DNA-binding protein Alba [Candidatus Bathyarchaeota archaeon]|nr:DNA-binding protein Alba [Candidatus Bathyarchaeota archaeon]